MSVSVSMGEPSDDVVPRPYELIRPLGLPRAAIRGTISLLISAAMWLWLLMPLDKLPDPGLPIALVVLSFLVGVFLILPPTYRQETMPKELSPFSTRNVLRFLVIAGFAGTLLYMAFGKNMDAAAVAARFTPASGKEELEKFPLFFAFLGAGVVGGLLLRSVMNASRFFQKLFLNLQAWVALIAILALVGEVVVLIVKSSLLDKFDPTPWECGVICVTALYFGTRL